MSRIVKCTKEELEYLDPVMGQLSDGIWENSPRMQAYWMCNSLTDEGIEMQRYSDSYTGTRSYSNPLYDMSDAEVRSWFADKLKAVVKKWLEDYPAGDWSRINDEVVGYLNKDQTVAGAYRVYDSLKGRTSKQGTQIKLKVNKRATQLEVGDLIGSLKVVQVIQPLTRRDTLVTVIYDNDEVQRIPAHSEFEVKQVKTIE